MPNMEKWGASEQSPDCTSSGLGVHVGAEDGVDAGSVAGVLAEPAEQVGVEIRSDLRPLCFRERVFGFRFWRSVRLGIGQRFGTTRGPGLQARIQSDGGGVLPAILRSLLPWRPPVPHVE